MLLLPLLMAGADPAIEPDLRCVVALSAPINKAPEERQAGIAAGILYFAGRIDGRRPRFDWRGALAPTRTNARRFAGAEKDVPRCIAATADRGKAIVAAGQALSSRR